ncbi:MAG: hypothetical protein MZU91_07725 [Desulfosudis oleivorans]|nr:hypothetical protein [Desulfosudis oleivorans]
MVPASAVDAVIDGIRAPGRRAPASTASAGAAASARAPARAPSAALRISAYLYDGGRARRPRGPRGPALVPRAPAGAGCAPFSGTRRCCQEELQEALHCGYLGLELEDAADERPPRRIAYDLCVVGSGMAGL